VKVSTIARMKFVGVMDSLVGRGWVVVKAIGSTRTTAFWESTIIRSDFDGRTIISGGGVSGEGAGERAGWGEVDGVHGMMGWC
jgi:hypothetical protein